MSIKTRLGNAQGFRDYFGKSDSDLSWATSIGTWRVFVLNSNCSRLNCPGLASWMKGHMARYPAKCTMAVWHHPRRSPRLEAGYNSAAVQPFLDVFVAMKGDVILNGHLHATVVSKRINASYGASSTGPKVYTLGAGGKELSAFTTSPSWVEYRNNTTPAVGRFELLAGGWHAEILAPDGRRIYGKTYRSCT